MFFFFFFFDEIDKESKKKFSSVKFANTANKGEWSELYTLYKLLVDQALFPKNGNEEAKVCLPIFSVLRYTDNDLKAEYRINDNKDILILADGEEDVIEVEKSRFDCYAKILLEEIKKGSNTFEISVLDEFRKETFCPKVKCHSKKLLDGSNDKSDVYIVIYDPFTGQNPKLGFSIKSELGSAPTLLNASELTNFRYKLSNNIDLVEIQEINSLVDARGHADIKSRVRRILNENVRLMFDSIKSSEKGDVFLENLVLIDSCMPDILAYLLLLSQTEGNKKLDYLTQKISEENPLGFSMKTNQKCYEAKVKRFITDVALGMVPSFPWVATHQAKGVLVCTESGSLDCYHLLYKEALEDYLFNNLKFETPSASRHEFGKIEVDKDGCQYFTLNLQLRFLK